MHCPDCHAENEVPHPELAVERKVFSADEKYDLRLAEDEPVALPEVDSYRVHCRVCEATIYCRPEQQGKPTICPDCTSVIIVPPPPPPKKKVVLGGADVNIDVAPTFDLPVQKSNADKLLAAAAEKVEQEHRQRPKPPKRPFRDGIWAFPFYLRVLPSWIVLGALGAGIMALFTLGVELATERSLASVMGLIIFMPMGMLCIAWTLLAAQTYMSIVSWTAMGYPTIQDMGHAEPWEWIRKALFFINALAVSCVPGFVLSFLLPGNAMELGVSLAIVFFLFPFVFLSMLDEESPVTVYSSYIWRTTTERRSAWRNFYALAGLIVVLGTAAQGVAVLLSRWTGATWPAYGAMVFSMCCGVWYFRVLGRLAWVLDEYHATLPADDPDHTLDRPSWIDRSRMQRTVSETF